MGERRDSRPRPDDGAFTLGELLVVVTILGVLAAVVVVATAGLTDVASTSACAADRRQVASAIEGHAAVHGRASSPTEADLVSSGFLRDQSDLHDVAADGSVVATGGCFDDDLVAQGARRTSAADADAGGNARIRLPEEGVCLLASDGSGLSGATVRAGDEDLGRTGANGCVALGDVEGRQDVRVAYDARETGRRVDFADESLVTFATVAPQVCLRNADRSQLAAANVRRLDRGSRDLEPLDEEGCTRAELLPGSLVLRAEDDEGRRSFVREEVDASDQRILVLLR